MSMSECQEKCQIKKLRRTPRTKRRGARNERRGAYGNSTYNTTKMRRGVAQIKVHIKSLPQSHHRPYLSHNVVNN